MSINIFVAGHNGMVGSAIIRHLEKDKNNHIITAERSDLDLTNQQAVNRFFSI
jgi:GDP-L-fucose synthase